MKKDDRTEMISIRVTPRDKQAFEKIAEQEGMTLSETVRACALAYLAMRLDPHGLKMLAQGIIKTVEDGLKKFQRAKDRKKAEGLLG